MSIPKLLAAILLLCFLLTACTTGLGAFGGSALIIPLPGPPAAFSCPARICLHYI